MFLKKITSIYLILSLLEFLTIKSQNFEEIPGGGEDVATYVETPNFNNLNPMESDMSDPVLKQITKHYMETILNKTSQNSDSDTDQMEQEQRQPQSQEDNNTSKESTTNVDNIDISTNQMTATEMPILQQQQPLKIDIPTQLDELNETDDIETNKKFFITTLIPEYLIQSQKQNQQQQQQQQNLNTNTTTIEINEINDRIEFNPTVIPIETRENKIIDPNDNETEMAGDIEQDQDYLDTIADRSFHLSNDEEEEYDSAKSSSTLLISSEINDTSEMANEMKHNIFYTDEIENKLKVYNHTNDLNENLMNELQLKNSADPIQESRQNSINKFDSMPLSAGGAGEENININENETIGGSEIEQLIDIPEMLIATTTTIPPSILQHSTKVNKQQSKQGKQILLPHEKLRNFIEDPFLRSPIAAIIDPSENVLERARILWKNALRPNTGLDIILLAMVNRTALPLIYHLDNTRTFLAGLNSMKESTNADPFSGILKATELIPYDSAIFICVESVEPNPELATYAGILLLKKRIKLYLIWFGDRKSKDSNEPVGGMLGKIALRSEGEIIFMDEMNNVDNGSSDLEDNMITLISDSFKGSQEIDIPVDTTVSSIQMKIDSQMRTATLETPAGDLINLKKIMHLKSKKFIGSTKIYYEIKLPLKKFNNLNKFKLKLIPTVLNTNYCLSIELEKPMIKSGNIRNLKLGEEFDDTFNYINNFKKANIKQRQGRFENYISTHENIRFPYENETVNPKDLEVETIDIDTNKTNEAQQFGGSGSSLFSVTKIDLSSTSQLLVYPGMEAHIDFEITNLREELIFHTIKVLDNQRYLRAITPQSVYVRPGQTATVRLIVSIPPSAKVGTIDDITFILEGRNQITQSAQLKVISREESQDRTPPYVTWSFGTRCETTYYNQRECSSKFWTLDVFAQDYETGILRISSTPNGIIPKVPFTAGTTEAVRSVYTASCCEPKVTIMVYDLAGNQRTYTIDVRDIVLTEASIAAIVLGVILLILLIGLLIGLIVWCCKKKRSRSRDLHFHSHQERN